MDTSLSKKLQQKKILLKRKYSFEKRAQGVTWKIGTQKWIIKSLKQI